MKTLDQIWDENFGLLTPAELGGYTGCGNDLAGSAEDNQKGPIDTLADKINSVYNDPAMSDAAKQAKIDQLLNDFFNGNKGGGTGPTVPGPSPNGPIGYPGNTQPVSQPSTDPTDGPIPPATGVPDFPDARNDIDMGGGEVGIGYDIDQNGNAVPKYFARGIKPSQAALLKSALAAGMAAKNAACAKNKQNPNADPNADPNAGGEDPTPKPPTPPTPLVPPPDSKPPVTTQPFRPIPPPTVRPPGGVVGGRPVKPAACWVAREVYGVDNPKWLQFREWMLTEASDILRNYYIEYGERIAEWIRNKPRIKAIIRKWMDSKINF